MTAGTEVTKNNAALYLAVDQGCHAARAIVFNTKCHIQAAARQEITTLRPRPGWIEHDPEEIIEAVRHSVCEL